MVGVASRIALERPWLLPVLWAVCNGARSVSQVAEMLGVPRRLAASLYWQLSRLGFIEVEGTTILRVSGKCDLKIRRDLGWYAAVVGGTVVVARPVKRRVRWFTLPVSKLGEAEGKLGYRAGIARKILGMEGGEGV